MTEPPPAAWALISHAGDCAAEITDATEACAALASTREWTDDLGERRLDVLCDASACGYVAPQ